MHEKTEYIEYIFIITFIMPVLLVGLLVWFFIVYQRRRNQYEIEKKDAQLREQALIIETQKVIENERNRIASEMHDDLGSGLTVMKFLCEKIAKSTPDDKIQEDIIKISNYSTNLVENMSEIIWAMNSRFDNIEGLVGYLRRFSTEFLEDHKIEQSFNFEGNGLKLPVSGEKRRNVFLVVKEILNNTVKYSGANKVTIQIHCNHKLQILIKEFGGKGFNPEANTSNGNGLFNIQKRVEVIKSEISFVKTVNGMETKLVMPLQHNNPNTHYV